MRTFKKLIAGVAMAATATAVAVLPALADPPKGVTPRATDVTGVGSDTIQPLFDQFSLNYNATVKASAPHLYSWDATGSAKITAKKGCPSEPRPNGSSAGILGTVGGPLGLTANLKDGSKAFCTDFARSSRARATGDPANITFVPFALDAVTFATNSGSNAPADLTTAQLASIYTCAVKNWSALGGKAGKINAELPQAASGTRKFFLTALGGGTPITPGPCVKSTAEENEGIDPALAGPNTIFPYSVADWIAQVFHSAAVNKSGTCKPGKGQNTFGCDVHGAMQLREVNATAPVVFSGGRVVLDTSFSAAFIRQVFVVVRSASTKDHVPAYLEGLFGKRGWIFTNKTAQNDIRNYGFLPLP